MPMDKGRIRQTTQCIRSGAFGATSTQTHDDDVFRLQNKPNRQNKIKKHISPTSLYKSNHEKKNPTAAEAIKELCVFFFGNFRLHQRIPCLSRVAADGGLCRFPPDRTIREPKKMAGLLKKGKAKRERTLSL